MNVRFKKAKKIEKIDSHWLAAYSDFHDTNIIKCVMYQRNCFA